MVFYSTLQELLEHDPQSKALFESLPVNAQMALQEQRQETHSYQELQSLASGFRKQNQSR